MHPGGAYNAASNANKQGYEEGKGLRQPYMQQGTEAGGDLMEMLKKLMNPGALQDEWSQGYDTSASAKQDMNQAQSAGMDAASSMGLGGSNAALGNIQSQASDIGQKDKQKYMEDMMQKYMQAMGLGQGIYNTGAGMASQGAGAAQQFGENQAGLNFGKYNAGPNMLTGGAGGIMKMLEEYFNNKNRNPAA